MKRTSCRFCAVCVAVWVVLALSWQVRLGHTENRDSVDLQHEIDQQMTKGWVDAITEQDAVIDDLSYPLASLKVYDLKGFAKEKSSLTPGRYVAFIRDDKETRVYLLEGKGERPQSVDLPTPVGAEKKKDSSPLKKVDGVWKN